MMLSLWPTVKQRSFFFCSGIIIRGAECQSSAYRSESWISGTVWCNWNWVKRGVFDAGNMVNPGFFWSGVGMLKFSEPLS